MLIASIPLGGILGLYCADCVFRVILYVQDRGESHNDALPFAAAGMLGLILGAVGLPGALWLLAKRK